MGIAEHQKHNYESGNPFLLSAATRKRTELIPIGGLFYGAPFRDTGRPRFAYVMTPPRTPSAVSSEIVVLGWFCFNHVLGRRCRPRAVSSWPADSVSAPALLSRSLSDPPQPT